MEIRIARTPIWLVLALAACGGQEPEQGASVEDDSALTSISMPFQAAARPIIYRDARGEYAGWMLPLYFADEPVIDCRLSLSDLLDRDVVFADFRIPLLRDAFDGTYDEQSATVVALGPFLGRGGPIAAEIESVDEGYAGWLTFDRDGVTYRIEISASHCESTTSDRIEAAAPRPISHRT